MRLPFTLKQLRIIKAIAYTKNFTQAAKMLFISQPTLSKQIKILENQLKIKLIVYKKGKIKLTEAGRMFLKYSERILLLCEESCRLINDFNSKYRGNIIIRSTLINNYFLIPRLLTLFIKNYPQLNIKLYIGSTREIHSKIIKTYKEIGIMHRKIDKKQKKKIMMDPLILVNLKQKSLRKNIFCKKDLHKLNYIKFTSNLILNNFIKKKIFNKQTSFKHIVELNSSLALTRAIHLGLGASFVFSRQSKDNTKVNFIKLNKPKMTRTLYTWTNA